MTIGVTGWRTSSYSGSQGGNCVQVAGRAAAYWSATPSKPGSARYSDSPPRHGARSQTRSSAHDGLTTAGPSRRFLPGGAGQHHPAAQRAPGSGPGLITLREQTHQTGGFPICPGAAELHSAHITHSGTNLVWKV